MTYPVDISGVQGVARPGVAPVERPTNGAIGSVRINDDLADSPLGVGGGSQESVDVQSLYGVLSTGKDSVNRVAGDVRGLGEAKAQVSQVRREMELIVKSFPPFPPGSMEREQFLNSVAGIRAMIERLSFPPAQHQAVSDTFSGEAFTDSSASDAALQAGIQRVGGLFDDLNATQAKLSDSIQVSANDSGDEASYVARSREVGKALHEGNLSIGQDARYMVGMLY